MSLRAYNLRHIVVDYLYLAATMAAAFAAAAAIGAEPNPESTTSQPSVQRLDDSEVADRRLSNDHVDSQLNTDDNPASGDPTESRVGKKQTNILGMALEELSPGNVRVKEVAATSPAWDAGIRRGDRVLSLHGIKVVSLAKWVEDVARVLDDTPDGQAVSVETMRGDERLALRIKLAVSRAAAVRDAREEELAIARQARRDQAQQRQSQTGTQVAPGAVGDDYGDDYYGPRGSLGGGGIVGGGGLIDDGGENGDDRMANRAVAQLSRVNTLGNSTGATVGGQAGIATFENNGQGVAASVVVGGLPQGSYLVGISQGGMSTAVGNGSGNFGNGVFDNGLGTAVDPTTGQMLQRDGSFRDGRRNLNDRRFRDGSFNDPVLRDRMLRNNQPFRERLTNQQLRELQRQRQTGGQLNNGQQLNGQQLNNQQFQNNQPLNNQQAPGPITPAEQLQQLPSGTAPGTFGSPAGGDSGGAGGDGGGSADGASLANPRGPAVLAQQIGGQATTTQTPATGQSRTNSAPLNAQDALPTQMPNSNVTRGQINNAANGQSTGDVQDFDDRRQNPQPDETGELPSGNGNTALTDMGTGGSLGMLAEIGVLQVGPDGAGQIQTQLEGMAVRNLAGLSVVVASTMSEGGNFTNESVTSGVGPSAQNPQSFPNKTQTGAPVSQPRSIESGQNAAVSGQEALGTSGGSGIVAAGVIQLLNDGQGFPNFGSGQPQQGLQQDEQAVDPQTTLQRDRNLTTPPEQQFDSQR